MKNRNIAVLIVFISLLFVGIILSIFLFNDHSSPKEYGKKINNLGEEDLVKIYKEILERRGYEVLYFGYSEISDYAHVEMKSLGSKNEQVWTGLFSLSDAYPNASQYSIKILEPTQSCWYTIPKWVNDAYSRKVVIVDDKVVDQNAGFQLIEYIIENPTCS